MSHFHRCRVDGVFVVVFSGDLEEFCIHSTYELYTY